MKYKGLSFFIKVFCFQVLGIHMMFVMRQQYVTSSFVLFDLQQLDNGNVSIFSAVSVK